MMDIQHILAQWPREVADTLATTSAIAIGLFTQHAEPLYLNSALRILLGASEDHAPQLDYLVAPSWSDLCQRARTNDAAIYDGWLTFDGPQLTTRAVHGRIWKQGTRFLLLASYDVEELEHVNHQIADTNSRITNLQRELARKNAALQDTLTDLRKTQSMLVHAEKMQALGQFTAGIAHEINNPLAYVLSNLNTLQTTVTNISDAYLALEALVQEHTSTQQIERAATIRQQADLDFALADADDLLNATVSGIQRVQQLVTNLRTFSRLDQAARKQFDLEETIKSTLAIAQPYLRDKMTVSLELGALPLVTGFPAELNQAFLNLIINAAQAIEDTGHLSIRGTIEDDALILDFTDTGHGMDTITQAHIFDPFFTTKPAGSGTGLGLAITYRIITDMHKGTITVKSEPDRGTTFTIQLPLDSDA